MSPQLSKVGKVGLKTTLPRTELKSYHISGLRKHLCHQAGHGYCCLCSRHHRWWTLGANMTAPLCSQTLCVTAPPVAILAGWILGSSFFCRLFSIWCLEQMHLISGACVMCPCLSFKERWENILLFFSFFLHTLVVGSMHVA